ncbi:Endoribonuclease L-PSP/chorismate mutase-like protein [Mycena rebaudengoi]|nr:Endoribonuclease L-PSP/chorismate mutase-like protein [Mycena rebaudengoi]
MSKKSYSLRTHFRRCRFSARPSSLTTLSSGTIGCTRDLVVVEGGIKPQTRAALESISIVLKAAGSGFEHITKANIYLTDMTDFKAMKFTWRSASNYIWDDVLEAFTPKQFFDKDNMPARTCVGVAELPLPGAKTRFEIECTALVKET